MRPIEAARETDRQLSLRSTAGRVLPWLPATAVLAAWLGWVAVDGGYFPRDWYPVAIGLVAVLAVAAAGDWALPASRAAKAALALLSAFVVWNFLSIIWADSGGNAWEAADKLLLVLAVAWILVLTRWTSTSAAVLLGVWSAGLAVACLITLAHALGTSDLDSVFIERRFANPLGYAGGSAALAAFGVWPALALSAMRETAWPLKIAFMAMAAFLAGFAIMPQARGAFIGLVATVPVLLLLAPDRGRLLARLLVVGAALALTLGDVLDVYSVARDGGDVRTALDDAALALGIAAAVAALGGAVIVIVERRVSAGREAVRRGRLATAVALGVILLAVAVVAVANSGDISDSLGDRWDEFRSGEAVSGDSRLGSTADPQRYDYWRVAVDAWGDQPVAGAGAGNFELRYTAERDEEKHSRYAHNLWLRYLSETGAVGVVLLLAFLALAVIALVAGRRRLDRSQRWVAAASFSVLAYFLVHASVDWIEEFPVLVTAALALPFVALKAGFPPWRRDGAPRVGSPALGGAGVLGVAALITAAVASLALPYLALRYTERAEGSWRVEPKRSFDDLDRAASLNPLSSRPYLTEGAIAVEREDELRAGSSFREAVRREDTWFPHFELAMLAAQVGRFDEAADEIHTAAVLNPNDPLVEEIAAQIDARRRVDPRAVHREIRRATEERFYGLEQSR